MRPRPETQNENAGVSSSGYHDSSQREPLLFHENA